jgi:hypothetical protein
MLTWLTRRWRIRAVTLIAALYAVCVIAPPVALAFTSGAVAAHCLTADHLAGVHVDAAAAKHDYATHDHAKHQHADGASFEHSDASGLPVDTEKQAEHPGSCCGLFCFAAVTSEPFPAIGRPVVAAQVVPITDEGLTSRGPDRLIRPPISL